MSKHTKTEAPGDVGTLAGVARALLEATSEVAGEKIAQARQRLSHALEQGQEIGGNVQDKVRAGAKASDECVRNNLYTAIGIMAGAGALAGCLFCRKNGRKAEHE